MEFRLLGPMEVSAPHGVVDVGPPRQRTVLASLLVDAGRTVMTDTVIDRVWGDEPPARARHALYVYMARLRRILAPAVGLVRRTRGYALEIDLNCVDLHRFSRLVEQGDPLAALQLWRGTPLADLAGGWAAQVREEWRRRHVEAATLWARSELHAGNARGALARLTSLVAEYPLVEPLAAELMRALHAAGLSADALRCYTGLRERLAQELGIEPGPQLRELHLGILRGEPETVAVLGETPLGETPLEEAVLEETVLEETVLEKAVLEKTARQLIVPRQLPVATWPFVGRPQELRRLDRLAREAGCGRTVVISAIDGAAGIGKTCLAVQWAHRVAGDYPDGQLYLNLRGFDPGGVPVEPSAAVRAFLDALDVAPQRIPADLQAQSALLRSRLAGKRMLLLLDNARDVEQVRPLLPGTAGCLVIVTSRHQLTELHAAEGARTLTLGLLSTSEARELLAARVGAERLTCEPDAADEIIARCGNLPLALVIVAARAAARPKLTLAAIAAQMRASSTLDAFDFGMDIRSVFSWSYEGIGAQAARLFRLLGLHPGPDISLAAAAGLAGCAPARARHLLTELSRASLIEEHLPERYIMHDLLRLFAVEKADEHEDAASREAATRRLFDHYLHTATAADRRINPHREQVVTSAVAGVFVDDRRALDWFADERRVLLALIEHATGSGWETYACQLDWALAHYLYRAGHWIDQLGTARIAVAAAHRGDDLAAQSRAHHNLARAQLQLGEHDAAHDELREAIRLATATGDPCWMGIAYHVMSWVLERRGYHEDAFEHAMRALGLFEQAGHDNGRARALNTIGWFHTLLGHHEAALSFCEEALVLLEKLGNKEGLAVTWHSIGHAHHHLGHHDDAVLGYQRALVLFTELQDRYYEGAALDDLGDTLHANGNPDAARDAWWRATRSLDTMNHPRAGEVRAKLAAA